MIETLKLILSLTLSGSILALMIFALKPFIKEKVSRTFQYYIWLLVLLRLVFPFSFEESLINSLFYSSDSSGVTAEGSTRPVSGEAAQVSNDTVQVNNNTAWNEHSSASSLTVQQKVRNGYYNNDADNAAYLNYLLMQTALLVWSLGVLAALLFHVCGYLLFINRLRHANMQASVEETKTLCAQLDLMKIRHKGIKLFHNRFSTTPMLIGLFSPTIIIPDHTYTPKQLESILRHELTHLLRWDIGIKWFSVVVTSLHWFNPLMILVKREMNRACELSCDERVIINLNTEDRQVYGETLIAVVTERKYPVGVLSTTMCEEKKTLKERLAAIMNYRGNSKRVAILSAMLFAALIFAAAILGAGVGRGGASATPSDARADSDRNIMLKAKSKLAHLEARIDAVQNNISGTGTRNVENTYGAPTGKLLSSMNYNLSEIAKYKTAYVGNNSKDLALVGNLPSPEPFFIQHYISLKTMEEPYGLTAYYEAAGEAEYPGEWPNSTSGSELEINSRLNALVLFAMIDNVEDISFAFRDSKSAGDLDKDAYDTAFSFSRKDIEADCGNLSELADDPGKLAGIIDEAAQEWILQLVRIEDKLTVPRKIDLLLEDIITPSASSNPGDYIRAHQKGYDEIVAMGKTAMPYLQSILDSGDKGLRGRIVEILIQDMTE
jgi:beta-lactamase regulating signal transducer with metallopeptidase domain